MLTLDCGATSSLISLRVATMLGLPISPAVQRANLANGKTRLDVCGEVYTNIYKDTIQCGLDASVVRELGIDKFCL